MKKPPRTRGTKKPRVGLPPLGGGAAVDNEVFQYDQHLMEATLDELPVSDPAERDHIRKDIEITIACARVIGDWEKDAPRQSDILATLSEIADFANQLKTSLETLDLWSLSLLRKNGAFPQGAAPGETPESEFDALCRGHGSRFVAMLDRLGEAASQATGDLADRGGSARMPWGTSAKEEIVAGCFHIFERLCPGEASTTVGGPFRSFVSRVYELATDKKDVDLEHAVKKNLPRLRAQSNTT